MRLKYSKQICLFRTNKAFYMIETLFTIRSDLSFDGNQIQLLHFISHALCINEISYQQFINLTIIVVLLLANNSFIVHLWIKFQFFFQNHLLVFHLVNACRNQILYLSDSIKWKINFQIVLAQNFWISCRDGDSIVCSSI